MALPTNPAFQMARPSRSITQGATMKRLTAAGALALAFLSGCANTSVTPAQVIADLQGAVTMLRTIEPLIVLADPKALSSAQQASLSDDLDKAAEALAVLSSGLPDDAMAAG